MRFITGCILSAVVIGVVIMSLAVERTPGGHNVQLRIYLASMSKMWDGEQGRALLSAGKANDF